MIFYNEWKLKPESDQYHLVFDQTLDQNLDVKRLKYALHRFISDYLIFNSHVSEKNQEARWVKNQHIALLNYFDSETTKAQLSDKDTLRTVHQKEVFNYVSKPFDLEKGPLYRFGLFLNEDKTYRFIMIFHHILIDANSFDNLIEEISQYYNNHTYQSTLSLEKQAKLITLASQSIYDQLQTSELANHHFWKEHLLDVEAVDLRTCLKSF